MAVKHPKQRRLSDLYRIGKEFIIDDGEDDPIKLYLRRPNPFEHEEALKDGNAARAKQILLMRKSGEVENEIVEAELDSMGGPLKWAEFVVEQRLQELYGQAFAYMSNEEEWSKDDLLNSTLENMEKWEKEPPEEGDDEYPDYVNAKDLLDKFNVEVEKRLEFVRAEALAKALDEDEEEVREGARRVLIDRAAQVNFYREYRLSCLYFAVRDATDVTQKYFQNKREVKEVPYEVQAELMRVYDEVDVSRDDVKNSRSAEASSEPSALSEVPETSEASGPEESTE